jgi:hypothetical protein
MDQILGLTKYLVPYFLPTLGTDLHSQEKVHVPFLILAPQITLGDIIELVQRTRGVGHSQTAGRYLVPYCKLYFINHLLFVMVN